MRGQWPEVEKENGVTTGSSLTSREQETGQCVKLHNRQAGHFSWCATVAGTTDLITCTLFPGYEATKGVDRPDLPAKQGPTSIDYYVLTGNAQGAPTPKISRLNHNTAPVH